MSETDHNPSPGKADSGFVAATKVNVILTTLSRITGLARDVVMTASMGLTAIADSFTLGFLLPNLFRRLFGEGALTAAFIPVYSQLQHNDPKLARKLGSLCLFTLAVLLSGITLVILAGLALLLHFGNLGDNWQDVVRLSMIMIPYMPMVCLVAIIGAMLQVHGRFAPAAGMPIFMNLTTLLAVAIAYILVMIPTAGQAPDLRRTIAYVVAWSVPISGLVQLLGQSRMLTRIEPLTRDFSGTSEHFWKVVHTMGPMLIALAVLQVNTAMDSVIASLLSRHESGPDQLVLLGWVFDYPVEAGGVAALAAASRLYQFPLGVFGIAIASAIFPVLSRAAAEVPEKGWDSFRKVLRQGLRLTVFIGLPASAGLVLVREPVCRAMFEWGQMTPTDSLRIAGVLAGFATAIWAYSMTHVITRAFYAAGDTRTPVRVSVGMVALNITLNLVLVWPLGVAGLAWATAICAILQNFLLLFYMRRFFDHIVGYEVIKGWVTTGACTAIMSAVIWPVTWLYKPMGLSKPAVFIQLAAMLAIAAVVFFVSARLLKCEELGWLLNRKKKSGA
jgi:putative peptidoglycan lipid II flippase